MRVLDWRPLLDKQRVSYIERGANVKRGELNVHCPFCGAADPSMHMGINLETGWWSCWRNRKQHSGKSPVRLLMRLLRIGYGAARELAGLGEDYIDPEGFDAVAARLMGRELVPTVQVARRTFIDLYPEFVPITSANPVTTRWWNYLYGRFFDREDINQVCRSYALQAARNGDFASRIVMPYLQDGRIVTWTGRAIGSSPVRYRDLEVDRSIVAPKHTLYNHDGAANSRSGRKVLVIVEGPFDALKVDFYGARYGVRAVGLSTNSASAEQIVLLEELAASYERTLVLMDNKTTYGIVDSMRMAQELATVPRVGIESTPFGRKDPGELRPGEVVEWAIAITTGE